MGEHVAGIDVAGDLCDLDVVVNESRLDPQLLDAEISVAAINYRLIRHADKAGIRPPVKAPLHEAARRSSYFLVGYLIEKP